MTGQHSLGLITTMNEPRDRLLWVAGIINVQLLQQGFFAARKRILSIQPIRSELFFFIKFFAKHTRDLLGFKLTTLYIPDYQFVHLNHKMSYLHLRKVVSTSVTILQKIIQPSIESQIVMIMKEVKLTKKFSNISHCRRNDMRWDRKG